MSSNCYRCLTRILVLEFKEFRQGWAFKFLRLDASESLKEIPVECFIFRPEKLSSAHIVLFRILRFISSKRLNYPDSMFDCDFELLAKKEVSSNKFTLVCNP